MKGQNLRIFLDATANPSKVIAAAKSCTFHIAAATEDISTKDSDGDWAENGVTGKSWDISTDTLFCATDPVSGGTAKTSADILGLIGTEVYVKFDATSGNNNRTASSATYAKSGKAIVTDVSVNAQNRQNATFTIQLTGTGALS